MSTHNIYLDNAATTPVRTEVLDAMMPYFKEKFGNPSSIHHYGRAIKKDVEMARKQVAQLLHAAPAEVFFTSGGTESINMAISGLLHNCEQEETIIITTAIEHHATLYSIDLAKKLYPKIQLVYLALDGEGNISLDEFEEVLSKNKSKKIIVSLMAANNEIGTLYDIKSIGSLCKKFDAIFICDMVQTIGHYDLNLKDLGVDIATASGHKFHTPKGIGVIYVSADIKCHPLLVGGSQERNMRAGTENTAGIIGFATALQLQINHWEKEKQHVKSLRDYFREKILNHFPSVQLLGNQKDMLYSLINIAFPLNSKTEMLTYELDMEGIAVSSGSACSSGSLNTSYVVQAIGKTNIVPIRFSFSIYNTMEEINYTLDTLKQLLG